MTNDSNINMNLYEIASNSEDYSKCMRAFCEQLSETE